MTKWLLGDYISCCGNVPTSPGLKDPQYLEFRSQACGWFNQHLGWLNQFAMAAFCSDEQSWIAGVLEPPDEWHSGIHGMRSWHSLVNDTIPQASRHVYPHKNHPFIRWGIIIPAMLGELRTMSHCQLVNHPSTGSWVHRSQQCQAWANSSDGTLPLGPLSSSWIILECRETQRVCMLRNIADSCWRYRHTS